MMGLLIEASERGIVPDVVLRAGIRGLLRGRLRAETVHDPTAHRRVQEALLAELRSSPVALVPERANAQHYELPAPFFSAVLGPRLKYSCCLWEEDTHTLGEAEEAMLLLTAARAGLDDGMDILDLGCGWGSFTLWAAEHYPASRILAVSNSHPQRIFIENRARLRGLDNVEVVTADANDFEPHRRFDRVVSVEMLEHVRNYEELLRRVASWLCPDGELFVHIFCHRSLAYPFAADRPSDWMGRHFFTGGLMPSWDLLGQFQQDVELVERSRVNGTHYARTLEAWLARLDGQHEEVREILASAYGGRNAQRWLQRWRIFFMACAECFAFAGGTEWHVGHYRFIRRQRAGLAVPA